MKKKLPDIVELAVSRIFVGKMYAQLKAIALQCNQRTMLIRYYVNRQPTAFDEYNIALFAQELSDALKDTPMRKINMQQITLECVYTDQLLSRIDSLNGFVYGRREYDMGEVDSAALFTPPLRQRLSTAMRCMWQRMGGNTHWELPDVVRLVAVRILIIEIYSHIRGIAMHCSNRRRETLIRYYLDRPPTEFDYESIDLFEFELSCTLGDDHMENMTLECVYSTQPFSQLDPLGGFVYGRMENAQGEGI